MWDMISRFIETGAGSRARGSATFSLIASTLISIIIYFITAIVSGTVHGNTVSFSWNVGVLGAIAVCSIYVFLFAAIWLVLYILENREAEDIYTWVRKTLLGTWTVSYSIQDGVDSPKLRPDPVVGCQIYINQLDKKLEMKFIENQNPIWADHENIIDMTAIRPEMDQKFCMIYYFKGPRHLQPSVASHIIPAERGNDPAEVEIELLGHVTFQTPRGYPSEAPHVREMNGRWFDLNGNVTRVFSIAANAIAATESGQNYHTKLADAPISPDNFVASMGPIRFTRLGE